jgi:hypothetical protein
MKLQKSDSALTRAISALSLSLLVTACGGGGGGGSSPAEPPAPIITDPGVTSNVNGTVLDAKTGQPLAGATVTSGSVSATTDAQGKFAMGQVPAGERVVLAVSKNNYANNFVIARVQPNAVASASVALLPVAFSSDVNVNTGGTFTVPGSSAQVTLAGNSVVRPDGLPIVGAVKLNITPINPALSPDFMPGDFTATRAGAAAAIESFGAMSVSLVDASGTALNLASGQTATLRIPLATRGAAEPSIPMFYFDTVSGLWVEQGSATLGGTGTARYFEAAVPRLAAWNADKYLETVKVTGCLKDDKGEPVSGARVIADGINYSGTASAYTNAAGVFSVPLKKSAQAALRAVYGGRFSNSKPIDALATDFAITPATDCLVLGAQGRNVSVKLTWGVAPRDVDSHLFTPDGSHVYYGDDGSLSAAPFANLDVDNTTGQGPEIITVSRLMVGNYRYAVRNYSGSFTPGLTDSPVRIELNAAEQISIFTPPAGEGTNTWWNVFSFNVDAQCKITVTPTGLWSSATPATTTAAPTYCAPAP